MTATRMGINISSRNIDATSQARMAFERLSFDLQSRILRDDMPLEITDSEIRFGSQVTSPSIGAVGNRDASIIVYKIGVSADSDSLPALLRGARALAWDEKGYFGLQTNGLPLGIFPSSFLPDNLADYDVLAGGVIRIIIGFQIYPDHQSVTLADGSSLAQASGQIVYSPPIRSVIPPAGGSPVQRADFSRVSALVVGVVAVDLNSVRLLDKSTAASQLTDLAEVFGVPQMDELPVQVWGDIANNPSALPGSLPLPVRQAVRVFERVYPLNSFPRKATAL